MVDLANQILDFMYVDRPKVASLLSQIVAEGVSTEESVSRTATRTRENDVGVSVGKLLPILGLGGSFKYSGAEQTSETIKRNPEWAQAKALAQYVSDVEDQVTSHEVEVGSLRMLSGEVTIYDLTPFKGIVENHRLVDAIVHFLQQNPQFFSNELKELDGRIARIEMLSRAEKNARSSEMKILKREREEVSKKQPDFAPLLVEGIAEFVRRSPFSLIAVLSADARKFWFTLREDALLHNQGDSLLKFGFNLEGEWSVAAIVDGKEGSAEIESSFPLSDADSPHFAYKIIHGLGTAGRAMAGRPEAFNSLMPLVIFRSLGAALR